MTAVTGERLAQLLPIIGGELQRILFGNLPKFCLAFDMPVVLIAKVAKKHGLPQDEALALAWSMIDAFIARTRWPD